MSNRPIILHLDSLDIFDDMSDEQAGKLIKAIRNYRKGVESDLDFGLKMAFAPFRNQFIRDEETYQKTCERNRINGLRGGRPNNPEEPTETQKTHSVIEEPTLTHKKKNTKSKNIKNTNTAFEPPAIEQVREYFKSKSFPESLADKFYEYYNVAQWKDSKGNEVKNWKQKALSQWLKEENKIQVVNGAPRFNQVLKMDM